jgi:hypothetical protein
MAARSWHLRADGLKTRQCRLEAIDFHSLGVQAVDDALQLRVYVGQCPDPSL